MAAYTAVETYSGEWQGGLYFAKSDIAARRAAANDHSDGDLSVIQLTRQRSLDQYEKDGCVPLDEMIWLGWRVDCDECGVRIEDGLYDGSWEGEPEDRSDETPQGTFEGWGWCSVGCKDEWHRKKAIEKDIVAEMRAKLRGKVFMYFRDVEFRGTRPENYVYDRDAHVFDSHYVTWNTGDPVIEYCNVFFRVPGSKSWATARYYDGSKKPTSVISWPQQEEELYAQYAKKALDTRRIIA